MKLEIVTYGDPVLRQKADRVEQFRGLQKLADDMLETLHASNGLGLAAQQVGQTIAICVIDVPPELDVKEKGGPRENPDIAMPLVLLNLEIVDSSGKITAQEGCLSFPEIFVPIARAEEVTASFDDLGGKRKTIRARGLLARAVQHELDHLNAVLLVDRMSPVRRISLSGKLKKLKNREK